MKLKRYISMLGVTLCLSMTFTGVAAAGSPSPDAPVITPGGSTGGGTVTGGGAGGGAAADGGVITGGPLANSDVIVDIADDVVPLAGLNSEEEIQDAQDAGMDVVYIEDGDVPLATAGSPKTQGSDSVLFTLLLGGVCAGVAVVSKRKMA